MSSVLPIRVKPLPLSGSGSRTRVGQSLAQHNQTLTMHLAQIQADTKYDPPPSTRPTTATFIETFAVSHITAVPLSISLVTAGILAIIYSLVNRR